MLRCASSVQATGKTHDESDSGLCVLTIAMTNDTNFSWLFHFSKETNLNGPEWMVDTILQMMIV